MHVIVENIYGNSDLNKTCQGGYLLFLTVCHLFYLWTTSRRPDLISTCNPNQAGQKALAQKAGEFLISSFHSVLVAEPRSVCPESLVMAVGRDVPVPLNLLALFSTFYLSLQNHNYTPLHYIEMI